MLTWETTVDWPASPSRPGTGSTSPLPRDLAARCTKAAREGRWGTAMRFYAGPRLLVIDEFGYRRLSEDGNAALFQVISQRLPEKQRGVDLPCRDPVHPAGRDPD